jgi:hypothetical protein|tara:strand:- start:29 stop:307 length:279 start_codon:yes stop_codon:yes gene_type:complete
MAIDFRSDGIETRNNPAIVQMYDIWIPPVVGTSSPFKNGQDEASRIPQLVGKVSAGFQTPFTHPDVVTSCCSSGEREPDCVGSIFVNKLQGV